MSLLAYHLKNLLLGLFFNSITNTENLMSDPRNFSSYEVASTSFALQIIFFPELRWAFSFDHGSDTGHIYVCHILFPLPLFFEESSVPKQLMS